MTRAPRRARAPAGRSAVTGKLSVRAAARIVASAEGGLRELFGRGFHALWSGFHPALERYAAFARRAGTWADREACSLACYVVGDVHDVNGAPLTAMSWYQQAIDLDPMHGSAWRELGTCQAEVGQNERALVSLERARALDPEDKFTIGELAGLIESPGAGYVEGDPLWRASEALARNRPEDAEAALEGLTSHESAQWRACTRGAANDASGVLAELRTLAAGTGAVRVLSQLWFFLPEGLWRDPRLWRCLADLGDRLDPASTIGQDQARLPAPWPHSAGVLEKREVVARQLQALGA